MKCEEVRELLELYALGVLEAEDRVAVAEHLNQGCERCGRDLKRAAGLNAAVLAAVEEATPPPALRSRIVASVRPGRQPMYSHKAWAGLAAGLTAAVVWLGVDNLRKAESLNAERQMRASIERESARLSRTLEFLRDPETRPAMAKPGPTQPRGTYYVNPRAGVLLIATNLGAAGPGKTYQMWVIPKGQAPRPAGLFVPDATGAAVHLQPGPVDLESAQALAITIEPEGGSAAPTTTPLLVTPLTPGL